MSLENVTQILSRALADADYRTLLFNRPDEALMDIDLKDCERSMLRRMGSAPYTLSREGLSEARRMVQAALTYDPYKQYPRRAGAVFCQK